MSRIAFALGLALLSWCVAMPALLLAEEPGVPPDDESARKLVVIRAGQVVDRDVFAVGEIVEISGTVNGDVYAVGGQILVDGTINGDLLALGGTVTVSGTVSQDARLVGGQVAINGEIGRNVTIVAGDLELMPSAMIHGHVVAAAANVEAGALIQRDVKIAAGKAILSNRVGGDVTMAAGAIRLTSKAVVAGNLMYWSKLPASIDQQAVVSGHVVRRILTKDFLPSARDILLVFAGLKVIATVTSLVSTLVLGLLLIHFYPNASHRAVMHLTVQPLASLGVGVLTLLLTPFVMVFLAITVVGLPLAFMLLAWYAIVLYVSRVFVIALVGRLVFDKFGVAGHERWAFLFGLVLYYVLTFLPVIGLLFTMLTILFGLGAMLLIKRDVYVAAKAQQLI